ncbi:MAG: hypothetical protein ACRENW_06125, partial [Thermodesulfobacteriota bacterium]
MMRCILKKWQLLTILFLFYFVLTTLLPINSSALSIFDGGYDGEKRTTHPFFAQKEGHFSSLVTIKNTSNKTSSNNTSGLGRISSYIGSLRLVLI